MEQQVAENLFQQSIGQDYGGVKTVENGDLVNTYIFEHDPDYVLQFPRADPRGFEVGVNLYEELQSSDIPVPEVVYRQGDENNHIVLEYLPGNDLNNVDNLEDHLFYQSGQILADIHQEYEFEGYGFLAADHVGLHNSSRNWRVFFQARTGSRIDELRGDVIDISESLELERAISDKVPRKPEAALLHNDYAGRNIRVGSEVEAVLDFDSSLVGDPEFDFVKARQSFDREFGERYASVFEEGYRSRRELSEDFPEKEAVYQISGLINEAWALKELSEMGRKERDDEEIEELVSSALELS